MAIEKVEDVLSVLGYKSEDIADASTLKAKIETEWFRRNSVPTDVKKQITKALVSSATTDLKRLSGENWDPAWDADDSKTPFEEIIKSAWGKREEKYKAEVEELRAQVGKPDEAISKLQKEKDKIEAKYLAESEKVNKLLSEFETYKTQSAGEFKKEKLNNLVAKAHAEKVKFPEKISELEKEGYWRKIEKNYRPDLDDDGNLIVLDIRGQRIPGKAANSYKTYEEVLEEEGIKNNVFSINNHARNQAQPYQVVSKDKEPEPVPARNQRVIAKPIS